jgi:maltose-binding protein MalE
MQRTAVVLTLLTTFTLLVVGCSNPGTPLLGGEPHILFEHDWEGDDAALLTELLTNFELIRPGLHIVAETRSAQELEADFVTRFQEGIEPDLLLTDALTAQNLIRNGYVKELSQYGLNTANFNAAAMTMVSDGAQVYGVPFALSTQLLFYNRAVVPQPPQSIEELEQVTSLPGVVMGMNPSFRAAYWGLRAFGGRSYDESGRFMLDGGALTNWLTALTSIQGAAGFVLSDSQDQLREQFLAGDVDLYVADAAEANLLAAALGDRLGIAPLPGSAEYDPAGPLLQASVLLISANADDKQTAEALEVIRFLTNSQQQSRLAISDTGRLAAANTVYVSPSMPPVVVMLATQISSAVPITFGQRDIWNQVAQRGQPLYRSVLEGVVDEQQAAMQLVAYVDSLQGLESRQAAQGTVQCPTLSAAPPLTLTVWHAWSEEEAAVLKQLATEFHTSCPAVSIALVASNNSTTLNTRYREAVGGGSGPDLLVGSTEWTALLAEEGMIRALNNEIRPEELSAFVPSALSAVQYNGEIFAYPESVHSVALFYNPLLADSPPKTLHELMLQVNSERGFAMPLSFFYAYWGLGAYGSTFLGDGSVTLDQGAEAWLAWLQEAAHRPGFHFTVGRGEAEQMFIERKVAFLVSGPWSLPRLRANLPTGEIAAALLPSGPLDRAAPILEVEGFMVNVSATRDATATGMAFARFVTGAHGARALTATGVHVPANVTIDLSQEPLIDTLIDQAQLAEGVIQDERWQLLAANGTSLYRAVALHNDDVAAAAANFTRALGQALSEHGTE